MATLPLFQIMMRVDFRLAILLAAMACKAAQPRGDADRRPAEPLGPTGSEAVRVCARPARGVIIGHDTVAGFSTRATLGALRQQCGVGDSVLYDAVGWQAAAWTFPFAGARVTAVQSNHGYGEEVNNAEVPDLWTAEGDSVRLPDGELAPHSLGALRARYGFAIVDANIGGDDDDGPHARSCRFPYLLFALSTDDTSRTVPDSARVTRIDMDTPGSDSAISRFCIAHQPPNER